MSSQLEANKTVVREFYNLAFNLKKPEEAVAKYLGASYRQHNPTAGDGPEPFIAFVRGFAKAFPSLRFDFKRMVAEDDLVVAHSHLVRQPGDRGMAVMDIFKLENGKIVEHWDVLQEIPATAANSNTML
ncbi:nuclear transport factor 2 family protein [Candidatus Acetothermia bacterium]|nr:nuclear transport factor 2 family protein [Candidatus Acetothermia bacterium]